MIRTKNEQKTEEAENKTDEIATEINQKIRQRENLRFVEPKFNRTDKEMAGHMDDMVEYVKMLTDQMIVLRQRQKAAERHICKYRNSAEESVESMLERLYTLRREQEELDKKLEHATDQIK